MQRSEFIKLSSIGISALSLKPFWKFDKAYQEIYSFPLLSGEVTQTSIILQSRLVKTTQLQDIPWDTAKNIRSLDIEGISGKGRFEISEDDSFQDIITTEWLTARKSDDFIIKKKITDLKPGTKYYYRVKYYNDSDQQLTSNTGQFNTHPADHSETPVTFLITSCMHFGRFYLGKNFSQEIDNEEPWRNHYQGPDRKQGYPALVTMRQQKPAFWVQTGDNVYYDHPKENKALKPDELRAHWHRQFALPRMADILKEVPVYFMKDDHDFRYNDDDLTPQEDHETPSPELGIKTFQEQVPVVDPEAENKVTYRTYKVNNALQIWMVEGRDYRSPNDMPDGPGKTVWGEVQNQWLRSTLLDSDATFKLLISPIPLVGPDDAYKNDNHVNYGGFTYERDQFFRWLKENGFLYKNFYIFCGDRHWQYHSVHPSGFEEFGSGSIVTPNSRYGRKPGDPESTDPLALINQPFIQEHPTGGFLKLEVVPATSNERAQLKITTLDKNGNQLYYTKKYTN